MDKGFLEKRLEKRVPLRKIAEETGKSLGSVRYWISKHGLKVRAPSGGRVRRSPGYCPRCERDLDLSEFGYRKSGGREGSRFPYCKSCTRDQALTRQHAFKEKAVAYKGGCCSICGYDRCLSALEFHHVEPEHKDFHLSQRRGWKFTEEVQKELDKCILVCANCHREVHAGLAGTPGRIRTCD